jgi:hypothetical protein
MQQARREREEAERQRQEEVERQRQEEVERQRQEQGEESQRGNEETEALLEAGTLPPQSEQTDREVIRGESEMGPNGTSADSVQPSGTCGQRSSLACV